MEASTEQLAQLFAEVTIKIKHLDLQRADLVKRQVAILNEIEKRKMAELEQRIDKKFDDIEQKLDGKVKSDEDK